MEQDNNLLYYFKNINHPLIQALKKTDTHALQQIINSGNFNPNVQLYNEDEFTIDPISYIAIESYPYTPNTYACIELLHKAGVPIQNPLETSNINLFCAAFDYKMFTYALSKLPKTASGKAILEKQHDSNNHTLFQHQCTKLSSLDIKALYMAYKPCFNQQAKHNRTVFHLIIECYLKRSLYAIFFKDHKDYPCVSEESEPSYENRSFFDTVIQLVKNDTLLHTNLYEIYCFLASTKQVDPKAQDESNLSPYQAFMWLLTKMYHTQGKYSAIQNAPYPPYFDYHWLLETLINIKHGIKEKAPLLFV